MPELRKDPIIGRWVIIATERAKRPDDFARPAEAPGEAECRYCSGKEHQTPPEIFSVRSADENAGESGWNVRVIPSMPPLLQVEGGMDRRGYGMYDVMNGIGAHEIIIDTPFHIANIASLEPSQIAYVFDACVQRTARFGTRYAVALCAGVQEFRQRGRRGTRAALAYPSYRTAGDPQAS